MCFTSCQTKTNCAREDDASVVLKKPCLEHSSELQEETQVQLFSFNLRCAKERKQKTNLAHRQVQTREAHTSLLIWCQVKCFCSHVSRQNVHMPGVSCFASPPSHHWSVNLSRLGLCPHWLHSTPPILVEAGHGVLCLSKGTLELRDQNTELL